MKKALFIILLLGLGILLGFNYLQQTKNELAATTNSFFSAALSGSTEAQQYLSSSLSNQETLLSALQAAELAARTTVQEVHLHSLKRASVTAALEINGKANLFTIAYLREDGKWRITSLPSLTVLEQAIISKITPEQVILVTAQGSSAFALPAETTLEKGTVGIAVALDNKLIYFKPYAADALSKLLAISEETIEGEMTGFHRLAADVVYFLPQADSYQVVDKKSLLVGMENLILYRQDNEVKAIILPTEYRPEKIRVLLNTTGFSSLSHQSITLTADTSYLVTEKLTNREYHFTSGQKLILNPAENGIEAIFADGRRQIFSSRLFIIPKNNGQIHITTIKRGTPPFTPAYSGHIEVTERNGALLLVNEVPLENYLYSVVPSEMPVSFGAVPLQVQAVAARTYAAAAIYRGGFKQYGAHVDDSVSSQVYNNVPTNPASTAAVNHTRGIIVKYQGAIADTRFFSTSAGVTANFEDVWHDEASGSFPGPAVPYLRSVSQLSSGQLPELAAEAGARQFFTTNNWRAFDQNSPWFRWQVEMTAAELTAVLNQYLPERYQAQPQFVLTKEGNAFVSKAVPADPLGKLLDLRVIRRGAGGNIMELEIVGEKGTFRLLKEYTIRFTLRPIKTVGDKDIILTRHDGSTVANYAILPSAFFVFDLRRDSGNNLTSIHFQGGGNGHGVGLSQWGSRGLAAEGRSFAEILRHYYPGCTLESLY